MITTLKASSFIHASTSSNCLAISSSSPEEGHNSSLPNSSQTSAQFQDCWSCGGNHKRTNRTYREGVPSQEDKELQHFHKCNWVRSGTSERKFVQARILDTDINFLLDSDSHVTIISKSTWDRTFCPNLAPIPVGIQVKTVTRQVISFLGMLKTQVRVGVLSVTKSIFIAEPQAANFLDDEVIFDLQLFTRPQNKSALVDKWNRKYFIR
ncbi:hypothetical protein Ciccas_007438 [Cichlidogyrus casuarinus]|uniref:Uncharacterized protein n=1 Tax=Cichlidogyrus casuarinus TaxID=1844966 RepID=A0ABD2Q2V7_9PLAT